MADADVTTLGGNGNATKIQDTDVTDSTPADGNILKYNAVQEKYLLALDQTSENATSIQDQPVAATVPLASQVLKYTGTAGAGGQWVPGTDTAGSDALSIQSEPVDATTPTIGQVLKYAGTSGAGGKWEPGADTAGSDATHIRSINVDSTAPTAAKNTLVYDATATEYVADYGAGVISDGSRSYLKDATENLGVGTGAAGALAGKIVAYNTGAGVDTKVVVEADSGHTALHLRADTSGTGVAGDRYAQVQFWQGGSSKAQLHYDPEDQELVYAPDGSASSGKGMAIKSDGRTGFHLNEKISNFTVKGVADISPAVGLMQPVPNETSPVLVDIVGSAVTTVGGAGPGGFLKSIGVGDRIASAAVPGDYVTVIDVVDDDTLTVQPDMTDISNQQIGVQRALASFIDRSNDTEFIITDDGKVGIGTPNPARRLVVNTQAGEGNCTIRAQSPDDQAILSLKADTSGSVLSGGDRDSSVNFQSGISSGESARLRYYADYDQLGLVLRNNPVVNDKVTISNSDNLSTGGSRGVRVGVRQSRGASGLSAKKLPDGQVFDSSDVAITAQSDFALVTHTISGTPANNPYQFMAVGDLVALSTAAPADSDYVEVTGLSSTFFQTSSQIGVSAQSFNIWLKPAHFRLEEPTTTETSLLVDGRDNVRIGTYEEGLDAKLNVNGTLALTNAGAQEMPSGANLAHIYYRSPAHGNDSLCRLLLHFDGDAAHGGAWADSSFGSTFQHIITSEGVTIGNSVKKFGEGAALFDGASYLIVDQMLGSRGEFFPDSQGFTLTAWLNLDSTGTIQPLWGVGGTAADWQNITYNQSTDTLACYENTGVGKTLNWAVPSIGLSHSTWHYLMIAYTTAGSGTVYVFVDGTLVNVGGTSMVNTWIGMFSTGAINIGYDKYDSGLYFKGHIDEFSYSATARQIASFISPTEPFYAEGLYCNHAGRSAPYRLKPTGS